MAESESSATTPAPCRSILSGRTLNHIDLVKVVELLERHHYNTTSYYQLGLRLLLYDNTLRIIEQQYRGEVGRCFTECLVKWLRKADGVENPTIDTLIAALRGIGENAVADGINGERQIADSIPRSSGSCTSPTLPTSEGAAGTDPETISLPTDGKATLIHTHAPIIIDAIKTVIFQWENLGMNLGIKKDKLDEIKYNSCDQVQVCRKEMIYHWIDTKCATCNKLIESLEKIGERVIIDDIKRLQTAE